MRTAAKGGMIDERRISLLTGNELVIARYNQRSWRLLTGLPPPYPHSQKTYPLMVATLDQRKNKARDPRRFIFGLGPVHLLVAYGRHLRHGGAVECIFTFRNHGNNLGHLWQAAPPCSAYHLQSVRTWHTGSTSTTSGGCSTMRPASEQRAPSK